MNGMKVFEVVGVRKAKSKTSERIGYTIYLVEDFTEYETQSGECIGKKVRQAFIYKDQLGGIEPKPGDKVHLIYDQGFGDKAQLVGIIPTK